MTNRTTNRLRIALVVVGAIALAVFWRTAYPTITWWDSSSYSTAAYTLGVTSPPGSLLLTLLGWPVAHLPIGSSPAHLLNLFAGLLAALTTALVMAGALRLRRTAEPTADRSDSWPMLAGAGAGALGFAFSADLWEHAIKFTPYILTALFTALILGTMLRWWRDADQPHAWRTLLVLGLLFGIDFSVHRTNALLIPAAVLWVALRRPRTLREPRTVLVALGGLVAGLSLQLLLIPIARATSSPLDFFAPDSPGALWDYVSLAGIGGHFLLNLWPRHSPLFTHQFGDLMRAAGDSFLAWRGAAGPLGLLPAVLVVTGFGWLLARSRRLGVAWIATLMLQAILTVVYFNIPANFFRPFDRHYLPIFITLGITMAFGALMTARWLVERRGRAPIPVLAGLAALALLPAGQLMRNWHQHDAAVRHFANDYARNALEALPPNAIYFTMGDNDTFPVFYAQSVEGVRPDVTILNLSMSNSDPFIERFRSRHPDVPLSLDSTQRADLAKRPVGFALDLPVAGSADSVRLTTASIYGSRFLPADAVLIDLLKTNAFRRPVTFAVSVGSTINWLEPHVALEGLHWRLVPAIDSAASLATLRHNLLDRYEYRGYGDPAIPLDDVTAQMIGGGYVSAFQLLATAERDRGDPDACRAVVDRYLAAFPLRRVPIGDATPESIRGRCDHPTE